MIVIPEDRLQFAVLIGDGGLWQIALDPYLYAAAGVSGSLFQQIVDPHGSVVRRCLLVCCRQSVFRCGPLALFFWCAHRDRQRVASDIAFAQSDRISARFLTGEPCTAFLQRDRTAAQRKRVFCQRGIRRFDRIADLERFPGIDPVLFTGQRGGSESVLLVVSRTPTQQKNDGAQTDTDLFFHTFSLLHPVHEDGGGFPAVLLKIFRFCVCLRKKKKAERKRMAGLSQKERRK